MAKSKSLQIVITGVSRGLGRAWVEELIARGQTLHGCARDAGAIAALAKRFPAPHSFAQVDVTNDAQVKAWAADVLRTAGPPDFLVNNAAIITHNGPLWEQSAAEIDAILQVNLAGPVNVIRHFVPAMVARRQGVIVNLSSGWGRSVSPEVAPYCATKWGIEGLTKALAEELPEGMAAVPLSPGVIDTDMLRSCFGGQAGEYLKPEQWVSRAADVLLGLGPGDNGESLSV
ncbi:MAG: SDR family oxidoreductase [Planctomycetes bacterium]|nr:SDR family oxidoreductase [Planctomycetota bacterium]